MPLINLIDDELSMVIAIVAEQKDHVCQQLLHVPVPELSMAAGRLTALHTKLTLAHAKR